MPRRMLHIDETPTWLPDKATGEVPVVPLDLDRVGWALGANSDLAAFLSN